jgi:hypothetical protein
MVGEIISESWARSKSVHPGEIVGISILELALGGQFILQRNDPA